MKINKSMKKVLVGLVRYPNFTDKEIASKVGIAPSNFAVLKKKVMNAKLITDDREINFEKIEEAKVMVFAWANYKIGKESEMKPKLKQFVKKYPQFFTAYMTPDFILNIGIFKSFSEAEKCRIEVIKTLSDYLNDIKWKIVSIGNVQRFNWIGSMMEYLIGGKF